jgi:hypothetical protein
MHIPPAGGPPPNRHDFEESFTLLEGEIEATSRGEKSVVRAGEIINIPATFEPGVSLTAVYQWSTGNTLTASQRRLKAEKVLGC